ncbi:MAG: creatininase family protein, partial [Ilumatobacter sp.]
MGQPTFLGDQTWTETAPSTLVIPIGSTEQHGPHLPVDTDTRIAIAVSEGAAAVIDTVAITPPIAITASGEHDGFPGTLSIGSDVMVRVLVELVRSARWAPRVVLVHG